MKVQVIPPVKPRRGAMRSLNDLMAELRAYRRACDRGQISSADAQRRCAMVHMEGEMLLAQKMLEAQGAGGAIDVTPSDGYQPPQIEAHRTKRVTVKRGVGSHGQLIDEKTVAIESNHAGDDPELDAEIEALT
jgi:hypothetical protein